MPAPKKLLSPEDAKLLEAALRAELARYKYASAFDALGPVYKTLHESGFSAGISQLQNTVTAFPRITRIELAAECERSAAINVRTGAVHRLRQRHPGREKMEIAIAFLTHVAQGRSRAQLAHLYAIPLADVADMLRDSIDEHYLQLHPLIKEQDLHSSVILQAIPAADKLKAVAASTSGNWQTLTHSERGVAALLDMPPSSQDEQELRQIQARQAAKPSPPHAALASDIGSSLHNGGDRSGRRR